MLSGCQVCRNCKLLYGSYFDYILLRGKLEKKCGTVWRGGVECMCVLSKHRKHIFMLTVYTAVLKQAKTIIFHGGEGRNK
jgi:hypothetical protein